MKYDRNLHYYLKLWEMLVVFLLNFVRKKLNSNM